MQTERQMVVPKTHRHSTLLRVGVSLPQVAVAVAVAAGTSEYLIPSTTVVDGHEDEATPPPPPQ